MKVLNLIGKTGSGISLTVGEIVKKIKEDTLILNFDFFKSEIHFNNQNLETTHFDFVDLTFFNLNNSLTSFFKNYNFYKPKYVFCTESTIFNFNDLQDKIDDFFEKFKNDNTYLILVSQENILNENTNFRRILNNHKCDYKIFNNEENLNFNIY